MKLVSILAVCSVFLYAEAHVVYSEWSIVSDDVVCPRPTTGECAKAGSCCGQRVGTQRMTRTCLEDHCDDAMLSKTRPCRLRCSEVDADAYGSWERAGNCERPESGDCSAEDTCCGQLKGTMKHTRSCRAAGGCEASTLERSFKCNVRCGHVNPCNLWPNPCQNGGTCVKDGHSHGCTCAPGYKGHHCETDINECASNPCQNGGVCNDEVGGYRCNCPTTHSGAECQTEEDINECASNPCQNGGICIDEDGGYRCNCPTTHTGAECQTEEVTTCPMELIQMPKTGVNEIDCTGDPRNGDGSACDFYCAAGYESAQDLGVPNKMWCEDGEWRSYGDRAACVPVAVTTCPMEPIQMPKTGVNEIDCTGDPRNGQGSACDFYCARGYESAQDLGVPNKMWCENGEWRSYGDRAACVPI